MVDEMSCEVPDCNQHFVEGSISIWHRQEQPWIITKKWGLQINRTFSVKLD